MKKNIVRICGIVLSLALSAASCAQGDITGGGETYYVVYDANGGTGTMEESAFTIGMPGKLRKNTFTHDVYTFGGWAETASGDVVYEDEGAITNPGTGGDTVTLYAKWGIAGFVWVPGGTFTMGSPAGEANRDNDETQHEVTVSGFYMAKHEVTQELYRTVTGQSPSRFTGNDKQPVENVSWYDAVEFCNELSQRERLTPYYNIDKANRDLKNTDSNDSVKWTVTPNTSANGYRLPTEAEWEYAARGGSGAPYKVYAGSDTVADVAWYGQNSGNTTHAVGTKAPNSLGLYDMSGNVSEWCWDRFGNYPGSAQTDPTGPASGSSGRVARGGAWYDYGARSVRVAFRLYGSASDRDSNRGFRLVRP